MTSARPDNWESWAGAAAELSRCIAALREDTELPEAQREELEAKYADQAVVYLRGAFARRIPGGRDLHAFKEFTPLFGSPVFEDYAKEFADSKP